MHSSDIIENTKEQLEQFQQQQQQQDEPSTSSEALTAIDSSESKLSKNIDEENYLKEIIKWLEENPHIGARKDRLSLLYFLRGCKYDLARTKSKIESFYLMKAERTEWFANRDPLLPEIQELLDIGVFLPLKTKDNEGRLVVIIRAGAHNPKKHLQNNVLKTGKMILDLILQKDESISLTGVVAIFDMKNIQLGHALQMTPTIIKHSVESWKIYPCKLKLLEFVNAPIHVNFVLNTFRFFMTQKMKSRIIVRQTTSKINATLPKELDGEGESYVDLAKYWKKMVEENVDFFKDDEQFKTIINDKA